eukprot:RCo033343
MGVFLALSCPCQLKSVIQKCTSALTPHKAAAAAPWPPPQRSPREATWLQGDCAPWRAMGDQWRLSELLRTNPSFPCLSLNCPEGYNPFITRTCPAKGFTVDVCCLRDERICQGALLQCGSADGWEDADG